MTNRHSYTPSLHGEDYDDHNDHHPGSGTTNQPIHHLGYQHQEEEDNARRSSILSSSRDPQPEKRRSSNGSTGSGRRGVSTIASTSATSPNRGSSKAKLAKEILLWDNQDIELGYNTRDSRVERYYQHHQQHRRSSAGHYHGNRRSSIDSTKSTGSTTSYGTSASSNNNRPTAKRTRSFNNRTKKMRSSAHNTPKKEGEETATGQVQVTQPTGGAEKPPAFKRTATTGAESTNTTRRARGARGGPSTGLARGSSNTNLRRTNTDVPSSRAKSPRRLNSGEMRSATGTSSNKLASQFMRKGVPTKGFPTTGGASSSSSPQGGSGIPGSLLQSPSNDEDQSDLSDPDDAAVPQDPSKQRISSSEATSSGIPQASLRRGISASTHTAMPRRESHDSTDFDWDVSAKQNNTAAAAARQSKRGDSSGGGPSSISQLFTSPSAHTGAAMIFSNIARVDRMGRLKSLNLNDSGVRRESGGSSSGRKERSGSIFQQSLSHLGLMSTTTEEESPPPKTIGSTLLAGWGKKYQVDQTVNLMDMESAERQMNRSNKKQQRKSIKDLFFGDMAAVQSEFQDVGLDLSQRPPQKPRRSIMLQQQNKPLVPTGNGPWYCGWPAVMLLVVVMGVFALVYSLVYDANVDQNGKAAAVTLAPTLAPSLPPMVAVAPTSAADESKGGEQKEQPQGNEEAAQVSAGATESELAPTEGAEIEEAKFDNEEAAALAESQMNEEKLKPTQEEEGQQQPTDVVSTLSTANRERWNDLVGMIVRKGITPREDFDDPNTSAYKALDWMIEYDEKNEEPVISSDNEEHIIETYALTVFYFATHPSVSSAASSTVKSFSLQQNEGGAEYANGVQSLLAEERKHDWIHQRTKKCYWRGVHCGHRRNVVVLNVTHAHLAGTLPTELMALEHLIDLDVSHNNIGGTLPAEWPPALKHVQKVYLSHNELEGTVPDTWKEEWLALGDVTVDNVQVQVDLSHNNKLSASSGG